MRDEDIERIAEKARNSIAKIPFAENEHISFKTFMYSDPIVYYKKNTDGYYEIIEERGKTRENKVASNSEDMVDFFVEKAIRSYAFRYEVVNRRKFESSLRQVDEIMEDCYKYIDSKRKFVKESYEDDIHIYLDLFDVYQEIVQNYKKLHPCKYKNVKADIDFICEEKYTDSPYGGISNVPQAMSLVRERIKRLMKHDNDLNNSFNYYEKFYKLILNK